MEAIWIILTVVGMILIIFGIILFKKNRKINKFRQNIKKGDKAGFYIDGDREYGKVTAAWKNHVNIKSAFSKKVIRRSKKEIY